MGPGRSSKPLRGCATRVRSVFRVDGIGEVPALNEVIDSGEFHSIQVYYNLLNPSAGFPVPVAFRGCDYGRIWIGPAQRAWAC